MVKILSFDSDAFRETSVIIGQLRERLNSENGVIRLREKSRNFIRGAFEKQFSNPI